MSNNILDTLRCLRLSAQALKTACHYCDLYSKNDSRNEFISVRERNFQLLETVLEKLATELKEVIKHAS